MKRHEALLDLIGGYIDGMSADSPAPSNNRSHSYRHGFAEARASLAQFPRPRPRNVEADEAAIAKDLGQ